MGKNCYHERIRYIGVRASPEERGESLKSKTRLAKWPRREEVELIYTKADLVQERYFFYMERRGVLVAHL